MSSGMSNSWRRWQERPAIDRRALRYFVYFLLDEDGEPVYIGRSCNVKQRIQAHHSNIGHPDPKIDTADWFPVVRGVTMVGPFNWRGAIDREREEIERHQPRGNKQLTARDHRPLVAARSAVNARRAR